MAHVAAGQVDRAEVRDAGRYTCEALNQAGRSEKHYNLNVWGEGLLGWAAVPPALPYAASWGGGEAAALSGPPGAARSPPSPPPPHTLSALSPSSVPLEGAPHPDRDRGTPHQAVLRMPGCPFPQDRLEEGR